MIKLLLVLFACAALSATAAVQHGAKSQKTIAKPSPAQPQSAPAQQAPAVPVTPEHEPSSPPDVSFQGGQLTIVARNSTMADVLNAVRQKTGAAVDMPPASGERVVGQFGPGAPRDVIAQLLNGSHYDYVLLGSPADPGALKKIVLMARASGPEPAPSQPQANQQAEQPLQAVPDVESENPDESNDVPAPMVQSPDEEQQSDQQQNTPVVKTPQELLRELQQQQQQQQQQQEQPPPGAPGAPPQ